MAPWTVAAINLAEHADNIIHTDDGARAAGFEGALVAGTTIHAYLTHPVAEDWGTAWLDAGWSELRLIAPVLDRDIVVVSAGHGDSSEAEVNDHRGERERVLIEASVGGQRRATLEVARSAPTSTSTSPDRTAREQHSDSVFDLAAGLGSYGIRAGDDLELYSTTGRAHPSVWPCIGNAITNERHVDGPWVHVRSAIHHLAPTPADAVVTVSSRLVDRFDSRAGERVVLDLVARIGDTPVARIEHESIVRLR